MHDSHDIACVHEGCINIPKRIIYLHGSYDIEEPGVDFRMFNTFCKNLDYLDGISNEPITIKMSTFGGSWNYGMAIYDCIRLSQSVITIEAYAHARSMSSIIPQAATNRLISKHADFMVHYGTDATDGDYRAVVNYIEHQRKQTEIMFNIYANKCIHGPFFKERKYGYEDVKKYIVDKVNEKVDWWLSAEEAVHFGFMDKVI